MNMHAVIGRFLTIKNALFVMLVLVVIAGCASSGSLSNAIVSYRVAAQNIELGQSKAQVLAVLRPTQAQLSASQSKSMEQYIEEGKKREIYFFRSRSFADGIVTDDEFTPYVFEDDKLVAIGWTAIGGPKTQAQTRDNNPDYHFHGRFFYY